MYILRMRLARYVARMGDMRNACYVFVVKPEETTRKT
jgi:hypothetical protein